jgi:hypothetical protein
MHFEINTDRLYWQPATHGTKAVGTQGGGQVNRVIRSYTARLCNEKG